MDKRPLSLTIIAWIMVIGGVFGLYSSLTIGSNDLARQIIEESGGSIFVQQVAGVIGCIVSLACAYGIFKGQPWSRVLYVAWGVIGIIVSYLSAPIISAIVVSALFVAVISFFLFRPAADRWFAAKGFQLHRAGA